MRSAALAASHTIHNLGRIPVTGAVDGRGEAADWVRRWLVSHEKLADQLAESLAGTDVLVNAAGLADPGGDDRTSLLEANAVLPGVLAELAHRAAVPRMVHLSSSAVQQRMEYLDESTDTDFLTPYAASKAAAEIMLLEGRVCRPSEVVIYRPTSVQAAERPVTRRLVSLASRRLLSLPKGGRARLPLCLLENVAAGIIHMVQSTLCPPIVLQPWEGLTTKAVLDLMGEGLGPKIVSVPSVAVRAPLVVGYQIGRSSPRVASLCHNLDILAFGKEQYARALGECGFEPPAGLERYRQIAEEVRKV